MVFKLFGRSKPPPDSALSPADQAHLAQLRTPSPTASVSAGTVPPQSPDVGLVEAKRDAEGTHPPSPKATSTNQRTVDGEGILPPASPAELLARIKKVPPKILHSYVASHIPHAPLEINEALMAFFATLTPPPKLHCVRCHKDFVEVENTDRSCLVPHDDESAEVEYVGNSKSKVAGVVGTTYETLWGCCNKAVEGDGDQGPPDGWCFEGFHTTDVKRARFRADSTIQDDKLVSCARMRCFNAGAATAASDRGRSQRAAARKSLREVSDEEEDYDERELAREAQALADGSDTDDGGSTSTKKKAPKRKRKSEVVDVGGQEDGKSAAENLAPATPSVVQPKGKGKIANMKPKSIAKPKPNSVGSASPIQRSPKPPSDGDIDMTAPDDEPKPRPKKPRKPRKSAGADGGKYVPPKRVEESDDFDEDEDKPKRKKTKRKSTASVAPAPV